MIFWWKVHFWELNCEFLKFLLASKLQCHVDIFLSNRRLTYCQHCVLSFQCVFIQQKIFSFGDNLVFYDKNRDFLKFTLKSFLSESYANVFQLNCIIIIDIIIQTFHFIWNCICISFQWSWVPEIINGVYFQKYMTYERVAVFLGGNEASKCFFLLKSL